MAGGAIRTTNRLDHQDSKISWCLAIACLLMTFIINGINRSSGVIFVIYMHYAQSNRETASWPFAAKGIGGFIGSPLAGVLSTRYSSRTICLIGGILGFVGSSALFFTTNIYFMSLCYGILRSIGSVMINSMIPSIISRNFKKHRATALGISNCGTTLGTFVFPALIQNISEEYVLNGTFLLIGAVSLHSCIGATILGLESIPQSNIVTTDVSSESLASRNIEEQYTAEPPFLIEGADADTQFPLEDRDVQTSIDHAVIYNSHSIKDQRACPCDPDISADDDANIGELTRDIDDTEEELISEQRVVKVECVSRNTRKDPKSKSTLTSLSNKVLLMEILKTPYFYVICFTHICIQNLNGTYTLVIVDHVIDKGVSDEIAFWMLTAFSVGEICGQLGLGWVTDRGYLTRQCHLSVQLLLQVASLLFLTYAPTYTLQLAASAAIGITQGTLGSTCTVMLTDYLSLETVTWAVSLRNWIFGILIICRAPLLGYFRDELGSYDPLFNTLCVVSFLFSLFWMTDRFIRSMSQKINRR